MEKAASLKLVALLAVLFCFVNIATNSRPHSKAIAVLDGSEGFKGTVSFYQEDGHHTVITVNLANLKAGSHGFHVHESGFIRATTVGNILTHLTNLIVTFTTMRSIVIMVI
ncbi:superoxide dismutase [Cu-Zn] 2-like [Citrus sinensis]|uniref:Superoxide dismutase copper/zinc binding domain-containing protein n=1 Tax=Citrus sinensis TaxID=2711 RepID=A0A067DHR3_CITSI|nr:superoxide dismutase [Cu-Zn] 2-like [Citrus sinensis]KDO41085.1 hypothetical protein CISIN_1g048434mg [Citrus sinensis]